VSAPSHPGAPAYASYIRRGYLAIGSMNTSEGPQMPLRQYTDQPDRQARDITASVCLSDASLVIPVSRSLPLSCSNCAGKISPYK
jgi:hypothetical protein